MNYTSLNFSPEEIITPCFVVDETLLENNLEILSSLREKTGCKVLLALKCFSMFSAFPLLRSGLDGICASSPNEARLGREEFQKEVHTFAAAYSENDILDLCETTDHLIFNSFGQLERFSHIVKQRAAELGRNIDLGIRINPEHSEGAVPIYDPCAPGSRLGVRLASFKEELLDHITGLHWHNLCEQNADSLDRTVRAVESNFGKYIPKMQYINFGGGHHITKPGYNIELLEKIINDFQQRWGVQVYLEPGEAVALNAGYLVSTVLDIIENDMEIAIIDASIPAHMPDVLEMPYRPHILNSFKPHFINSDDNREKSRAKTETLTEKKQQYCYRIGGLSCLAGDVAGEYLFDEPLHIGEKLLFTDMAIYTMVKTNTFNGVQLPSIALVRKDDRKVEVVRKFNYHDFKNRL